MNYETFLKIITLGLYSRWQVIYNTRWKNERYRRREIDRIQIV